MGEGILVDSIAQMNETEISQMFPLIFIKRNNFIYRILGFHSGSYEE
jgi:hypothetical protein